MIGLVIESDYSNDFMSGTLSDINGQLVVKIDDIYNELSDSGTGDNNTGGGTDPVVEDVALYSSTAGEDHANHWASVDTFGNGATFNGDATDPTGTYARVFSIESGTGYGDGVEVAFAAFTGLGAGFLSGMDAFHAKVYGSPLDNLEVKFTGGTDSVATIDLTTYAGATDLGNGWYDVTIPFSEFSNNAESNIDAHTGYLIGPPGDQADSTFTFYFTDTGLSSGGSVLVDMGLITSTFISMETTNDGTVTDFFPMNDAGDYYVQLNLDAALTTSSGDSFTTFNVPLTVADSVYGSNNATTIDGTDGSDWLYGLGGNDTITGGAGDDVIQGGLGKDTLTGGDGADTFILSAAEAVTASADADHITDYTAGTDSLALDGGLEFADLTITDDGTDSTVTVTATGAILAIIEGDAGLAADDFA
jgi:Ca2+-binding RTX toxin-like protein